MAANGLMDTGAILAILRPHDRWHPACIKDLVTLRLPLLTSEAVLTELFHLVGSQTHNVDTAWAFVHSGALALGSISDADLPALSRLVHQYRDRPMDFADATLVHLAQRESLSTILTVDVNDFQTYRITGQKRFRILPGRVSLS
jgi:predicted nucleic acid-binding protein